MPDTLMRAFRFQVTLRKSVAAAEGGQPPGDDPERAPPGDGAFQECSGLEVEMDVHEYQEGGRNDGVIRQVGRAKYANIVLKRGMFYDDSGAVNRDLWDWLQGVVAGRRPVPRYDGIIEVFSVVATVVATWVFDRGVPAKVRGPELNARTGEIAIEELTIAHEGLRLVAP
jgi:phage tail-like protein